MPARLVNVRAIGSGFQGDLAYEIRKPALLAPLRLPPEGLMGTILPPYVTRSIAMAGVGRVVVDPDAVAHRRWMRRAEADAHAARLGIRAAPEIDFKGLRRLLEP